MPPYIKDFWIEKKCWLIIDQNNAHLECIYLCSMLNIKNCFIQFKNNKNDQFQDWEAKKVN